jgi:hypothetical protein
MEMGEATYYFKADNGNLEKLTRIKAFFSEGMKAENYWQNNRDLETTGHRLQFWETFVNAFPLVSKYLDSIGLYDRDCNNDLAGHLDFGYDGEHDLENFYLTNTGEIGYSATVWHFADWNGLMNFLESEFGLTNTRWISDEYIDPFDLL